MKLRERRFDIGTIAINDAEGSPNGPPFVILHGGAGSGRYTPVPSSICSPTVGTSPRPISAATGNRVASPRGLRRGRRGPAPRTDARPHRRRRPALGPEPAYRGVGPPGDERALVPDRQSAGGGDRGRPPRDAGARARNGGACPGGDAFGEASPWFAFQALNLHRLDPDRPAGPEAMLEGYAPEALLAAITRPVLILRADPAVGGILSDREVALAMWMLPRPAQARLTGIGRTLPGTHPREVCEAISPFLVIA